MPAATTLHNFVRARWPDAMPSPGERESLRAAILRALMVAPPGPVVKLLAETFRIVVTADVTRGRCWPDLLPALCTAMQESNLMVGKEQSPVKTANVLIAVHTLLKPYKYFQNPGVEKEAAPPELEAIVKALLEPLLGMLGILAAGTLAAAAAEHTEHVDSAANAAHHDQHQQLGNDALLHTILKCFHHTVAAYMPVALVPSLQRWLEVLLKILEQAPSFAVDDERRHAPRARAVKRIVQALVSLVTRHRRLVDKVLPAVCSHAASLAGALSARRLAAPAAAPLPAVAARQCALCFDLLARVSETAPGYKLLAPNFGRLLESAVFPALCAAPEDANDWEEDEEEYLQRTLPTDSDDATGFNEELFAPRQSAANLLGLLAERGSTGGAPGGGGGGGGGGGDAKRKKVGGKGKASGKQRAPTTPGDVALRFFERFQVAAPPAAAADPQADSAYYGVLIAYGALAGWLKSNAPKGTVSTLARQRILPVLLPLAAATSQPSPEASVSSAMLRANACWALGELSATEDLPEEPTHAALLHTLTDPLGADQPAMRSAAASAIAAALRASCWPEDWAPLLTAAATAAVGRGGNCGGDGGDKGDNDADTDDASRMRALRLIAVAAEVAPEHCGVHAVAVPLAAALAHAAATHTPAPPAALPPIVETALEALVAVVDAALDVTEDIEEDGDGGGGGAGDGTHPSLVALVPHICDALRRAWLPQAWGLAAWSGTGEGGGGAGDRGGMDTEGGGGGRGGGDDGQPVSCCMGDCSRLLSRALQWCPDTASAAHVQLGALVYAHAALLPEWDAWEEEEDEAATVVVADAIAALTRGALTTLPHPPGAIPHLLAAYAQFLASAIDAAPALGAARACRQSHALLSLCAAAGLLSLYNFLNFPNPLRSSKPIETPHQKHRVLDPTPWILISEP
jgi:uncharacterized membrane protein YgcG